MARRRNPSPRKYYHVTKNENVSKILKEGISPASPKDDPAAYKGAYVSKYPHDADWEIAAPEDHTTLEITVPKNKAMMVDSVGHKRWYYSKKPIPPENIKVLGPYDKTKFQTPRTNKGLGKEIKDLNKYLKDPQYTKEEKGRIKGRLKYLEGIRDKGGIRE